jgi:DNA-binding NtrC family response regulator
MVQRAVVLAEGPVVDVKHFPAMVLKSGNPAPPPTSYDEEVKKFKRRLILRTLQECGGNKAETARTLGLARGYLHRLINDLDIRTADPDPDS